jgi:hypothetical protein
MGRDISFFDWRALQQMKELDKTRGSDFYSDTFYEESVALSSASLGSGDAWPVYLRWFLISTYRRIAKLDQAGLPTAKHEMLATLLRVCPANCKTIDEAELFEEKNQIMLTACDAGPIIDLMTHHRQHDLGCTPRQLYWHADLIKRAAALFASLSEHFAPVADDPFVSSFDYNNEPHSVADVIEAFTAAAKCPFAIGIVE